MNKEKIFESFKILKQEYGLGESKFKKLTADNQELSKRQLDRYRRTFQFVVDETKQYGLIDEEDEVNLRLTDKGKHLLSQYQKEDVVSFNQSLFELMEQQYKYLFRYFIEFLYSANKHKPGLLIFPYYSPRLLNMNKSTIKTTNDIIGYSKELVNRLQQDIKKYLGKDLQLI